MNRRRNLLSPLTVTLAAVVCLAPYAAGLARDTQPGNRLASRLTDKEFWRLVVEFSEPGGYFQSDNLVSNERPFQNVVPALRQFPRGGVYLGVAPEQNFTYIAALEPRLAFIIDIRRGNLVTHLLYKALLELSPDRADFLSRLFSRRRPPGLSKSSTVHELFAAYDADVEPDPAFYKENLRAITDQLTKTHGFDLHTEDRLQLEAIFGMFLQYGPGLTYASSQGRGGRNMPSYAELQMGMDLDGQPRAFLASEEHYNVLRAMAQKNLIVPIVGDFAGPKALKAIGRYVAEQGATVTAYYTSNVEQYLFQNGVWQAFYANVATLPVDERSTFIRSARGQNVLDPIQLLLKDVAEGKIQTYASITSRGSVR